MLPGKVLIEGNQVFVIAEIPVGVRSALRIKDRIVGVLLRGSQQQCLPCNGLCQRMEFICTFVIKLGQQ